MNMGLTVSYAAFTPQVLLPNSDLLTRSDDPLTFIILLKATHTRYLCLHYTCRETTRIRRHRKSLGGKGSKNGAICDGHRGKYNTRFGISRPYLKVSETPASSGRGEEEERSRWELSTSVTHSGLDCLLNDVNLNVLGRISVLGIGLAKGGIGLGWE